MISRSFCWAIMKKITKKWDLETSNAETELKIGIYAKNWAKQVQLKIFYFGQSQRSTVRVNSQRLTCADVAVWHHLGLTWQKEKQQQCVWCVSARGLAHVGGVRHMADTSGAWQRVEHVLVRQKLQPARGGACDAISGRSWLGFAWDWPFCLSMPVVWQLNA